MAETTTSVFRFVKPDIGGSKETWGNRINKNLDDIDFLLAQQNSSQWTGLQNGLNATQVKDFDNAGNVLGTALLTDERFRTAGNVLVYTKAMTDTISAGTTEFFDKTHPGILVPQQLAYRMLDLLLPVGAVIQWSGNEANVPAGWRMCGPAIPNFQIEGGGGAVINVPDMRGRFVMAAYESTVGPATMRPGMTSGTAGTFGHGHTGTVGLHTLIPEEIPPHLHGSNNASGSEAFMARTTSGGTYALTSLAGGPMMQDTIAETYPGSSHSPGGVNGVVSGHSHPLTINANTVPDSPWYAICFIIKVRRWETWVPP